MKAILKMAASCMAGFAIAPAPAGEPALAKEGKSSLMEWLEGDYLLGDWGGLRTDLSARGVDFEFFYLGSMPSNLQGGAKTGTTYQGGLIMALDLDSEKLAGYHGGRFHLSGLWLSGADYFSEVHIGDFNKVNLTDFPNAFRLWEAYYEQKLLSDKLTLKAGVMAVDSDFIAPEFYNSLASITFLNQTFFYPTLAFNLYDVTGFPEGKHALPSTPYGALGFLARVEPSENFYIQAAVYDGNPDRGNNGLDFRLNSDEGALFYFESGVKWNTDAASAGLPGALKIGGFYHTDEFYDAYQGASYAIASAVGAPALFPRDHSGNYGGYLLAEQYLWLEESKADPAMQGLVGFLRLSAAPQDRNLTKFGIDGGVVFKGLIPGRDWDTLGLAASYLRMSNGIRNAVRDANTMYGTDFKLPDYEGVIELSYKAQITAWWTLQPSLQWVLHPGGGTDLARQPGDAIAFVLQTTLRL